ncbi:Six-hairpin glycosidase-like protein [Gaertneriomyces semiglobifer]|nr:Six-hairpin glycosidase-like protein [Gaertneriomyces semiglobifer]
MVVIVSDYCSLDGSIDMFCYPRFDSPSIFARILDQHKGGHFHINPVGNTRHKQQYLPNNNILQTRFMSEEGVIHVTDYMHVPSGEPHANVLLPWLIRQVECRRGTYKVRVEVYPAFDYARARHTTKVINENLTHENPVHYHSGGSTSLRGPHRVLFDSENGLKMDLRYMMHCSEATAETEEARRASEEGDDELSESDELSIEEKDGLKCHMPRLQWNVDERDGMLGAGVWAEFQMCEGQRITFVFREVPPVGKEGGEEDPPLTTPLMDSLLRQTARYWVKWINKSTFKGRWREVVYRSALALKLMIYEPTGAVVAAPTFGIPEEIGGVRNWDYRYTWIRDSAFTVYALVRIGLTEEAEGFMRFIEARCQELNSDGSLQVMYGIDGRHELPETSLDHLEGYRGSKPVRVGNAAYDHLQLDIYGELLDSIYLYNKYRSPISYDTWVAVRRLVNYVCDNWHREDMSIWEVRGNAKNFVYSKVMCWVAVDRGLRLAEKRSLPCPDRDRWFRTRDEIYETVMARGYSKTRNCFVQSFEDIEQPILDASLLVMPLCFFISPTDPRLLNTIKEIMKPPRKGGLLANNLVYRYDHSHFSDGLSGGDMEGSFSMCTFWLVEALTRAGQWNSEFLQRAIIIFEQMIAYGNHVTLFSEEIARTGEMLGNFPQAFTHIALMSAAFNLDKVLSGSYVGST